jgi:hypothetical protein
MHIHTRIIWSIIILSEGLKNNYLLRVICHVMDSLVECLSKLKKIQGSTSHNPKVEGTWTLSHKKNLLLP